MLKLKNMKTFPSCRTEDGVLSIMDTPQHNAFISSIIRRVFSSTHDIKIGKEIGKEAAKDGKYWCSKPGIL
jgi:hypothetical protein